MDFKTGTQDDWDTLSTMFNTCQKINSTDSIDNLYSHLSQGYVYVGMTDYPYAADYIQPMPAFPVNASCEAFKDLVP